MLWKFLFSRPLQGESEKQKNTYKERLIAFLVVIFRAHKFLI